MAAQKKAKKGAETRTKKDARKAPAKAVAKAAPVKVPAKKTPSPKKVMRAPAKPVKKTVAKKQAPAAKAAPKKAPPQQPKRLTKATPVAEAAKKDVMRKAVSKSAASAESKKTRLHQGDLDHFKLELLAMRDRITGQSGSMRSAALQRHDETNPEEDGTDAFLRLQTLEQVSSQQQIIGNIDEALRAIEKGSYGVCDMCGELISKPRLSVLPFAKNCIKCQSEMERPNRLGGRR